MDREGAATAIYRIADVVQGTVQNRSVRLRLKYPKAGIRPSVTARQRQKFDTNLKLEVVRMIKEHG